MTKRLLPPAMLSLAALATVAGCPAPDDPTQLREPYVDEWETVDEFPAAQFGLISIGDRLSMDNFSNRGDVEVRYEAGISTIKVEMQRFTVASDQAAADEAFGRMLYWGYDASAPEQPTPELDMTAACNIADPDNIDSCYIRAYYDGLFQPLRDGANFRVTIPAGWDGDLIIETSDNLEEGVESYPDRSDVIVDGVAGNLSVNLDSGNVDVRMDPNTAHYAGCGNSEACEMMGHVTGCGCTEPTNITVANNSGQASNITVDVGDPTNWYTMILENRGTFSSGSSFICTATIDCSEFDGTCELDPAYTNVDTQERAEINYPGGEAIAGAGMRIALASEDCANIEYVNGPEDYESDALPEEKRGDVKVCVGCFDK